MSDEVQRSLQAELDRQLGARPDRNLAAVMQRGRRKRALTWMVMGTVAALIIGGAGIVFAEFARDPVAFEPSRDPQERQGDDASVRLLANGCPRSKGKSSSSRWTSPTVRVAAGINDGNDWVLCARTVEHTKGPRSGDEALCTDWLYGEGLNSGMGCMFSYAGNEIVPLDESYFFATSGPDDGYFLGAVPAAAVSVTLETDPDATIMGEIHPAPSKLNVPFRFFTLFAEPYAEGTLIVRDADGEVIRRRVMEHGLSRLFVTKAGGGEGTVMGFRTELLEFYEDCQMDNGEQCREPRPTWIECGRECEAALDGARITLVAEPADGSRFLGWSGACSGTGRCELVVDEPLTVTATFAESP